MMAPRPPKGPSHLMLLKLMGVGMVLGLLMGGLVGLYAAILGTLIAWLIPKSGP